MLNNQNMVDIQDHGYYVLEEYMIKNSNMKGNNIYFV